MTSLCGTIWELSRSRPVGIIQGDDGQTYRFRRDDMVNYLAYLELQPGDRVRFEIGTVGNATKVEREQGGGR